MPPDSPPAKSPSLPSVTVRQWVSLALVLHGICVAVGLLYNYNSSMLLNRLNIVLSPYVATFHLSPEPATLYATHAVEEDASHLVEVLETTSEGQRWTVVSNVPFPSPARTRQQRVARLLAALAEQESEEHVARIVRDMARWANLDGRDVRAVRVRRYYEASPGASAATAGYDTVYVADVLFDGESGAATVLKRTSDNESARVMDGEITGEPTP